MQMVALSCYTEFSLSLSPCELEHVFSPNTSWRVWSHRCHAAKAKYRSGAFRSVCPEDPHRCLPLIQSVATLFQCPAEPPACQSANNVVFTYVTHPHHSACLVIIKRTGLKVNNPNRSRAKLAIKGNVSITGRERIAHLRFQQMFILDDIGMDGRYQSEKPVAGIDQ